MTKKVLATNNAVTVTNREISVSERIYVNLVHWITIISAIGSLFMLIFIMLFPSANMLNPYVIFEQIFSGATPDKIWALSAAGGFPGGHVYFSHSTAPDSWAQFFINIGCSVGLWGLIPAIIYQLLKEKNYLDILLSSALALLILLAMLGIIG